jgi:hypothetical protein
MICDFQVEQIAPSTWQHTCRRCGRAFLKPAPEYHRQCASGPPEPPPIFARLANFTKAAIGHVLNGCPTCDDGEIARRHAICKSCELYSPDPDSPDVGICTHASCGCTVRDGRTYLSKLGWADQECPLGKWSKLG